MKEINLTFAALIALLAVTTAASYLPMNLALSQTVGYTVALAKCVCIGAVFMKLKDETPSMRYLALAALVWVGILAFIVCADYKTRNILGILGK